MLKLSKQDLMPLERYSEARSEFRSKVMAHKKKRLVAIGPHVTVHFEDRLTIQYQIQEMLRVERIFESQGIQEELDAYNPLIPEGSNWKATFMIEFDDPAERAVALRKLLGIEDKVWAQVDGHERVYAIADEDLERDNGEKTASVHFMRFELNPDMVTAAKAGANIGLGIDHGAYTHSVEALPNDVRDSLAADLG